VTQPQHLRARSAPRSTIDNVVLLTCSGTAGLNASLTAGFLLTDSIASAHVTGSIAVASLTALTTYLRWRVRP
jgi:hypothetical protein